MSKVVVEVPIRTISEANRSQREHWRSVDRRVKRQRDAVGWALIAAGGRSPAPAWPVRVTVTRIAPRALDGHDNLPGACKHVVDEVSLWLGLKSDRDPRVQWRYAQERAPRPRFYAVRIEVETAAQAADIVASAG